MHGSTYMAALFRQLPGPVQVALFGPPRTTGSYVYRDLIDFHDPNGRSAFSLPSESYLNYGLAGSFIVALIVGSLFGWAYRRAAAVPSKALHVLSPILVATLPLSLRGMLSCRSSSVLYPNDCRVHRLPPLHAPGTIPPGFA
jgi:hypothetical protein